MNTHPLLPKLRALGLSGMADTLDERVEIAKMRNLSHQELLALLLDDEIDRRSQRRHERMVLSRVASLGPLGIGISRPLRFV